MPSNEMNDPLHTFRCENRSRIIGYKQDVKWFEYSRSWLVRALEQRYVYNFDWLGRPIIQLPSDILAMQEIIWDVKPDLIIEMGVAHGGSLILHASILSMIEYSEAVENNRVLDPSKPTRCVLGVDIDIRGHNRKAIEEHSMASRIELIEGSSISEKVINKVRKIASEYSRILVCLDSNHTHQHVLAELEAYAPLVSKGSYCVVFDTVIEDLPKGFYSDRPWDVGDNPKTAVAEYLERLNEAGLTRECAVAFDVDAQLEHKIMLTVAPGGFLRRL